MPASFAGRRESNAPAIYVHVPFCIRKCDYCDFLSFPTGGTDRIGCNDSGSAGANATVESVCAGSESAGADTTVESVCAGSESAGADASPGIGRTKSSKWPDGVCDRGIQARYFAALFAEIEDAAVRLRMNGGLNGAIPAVYIGGGTPTVVDPAHIEDLLSHLRRHFTFSELTEISMECNPGTADADALRRYRTAGVNRLSIGVQSFSDNNLRLLGRIHTAEQARRAFALARAAGFDNINLDLMACLPGQTVDGLMEDIRAAVDLGPEHISLYSLIIEPGTPFYERYADQVSDPHYDRTSAKHEPTMGGAAVETQAVDGMLNLPDEDSEREMMHAAWEALADAGYERYEISNFARRREYRCRQNLIYWQRGGYLGLGLGAASLLQETRHANTRDLAAYLAAGERPGDASAREAGFAALYEDVEILDEAARMSEFMFLGLRLAEGVGERRFSETFGRDVDTVYGPVLSGLMSDGLIARRDGRIFLTSYGTDIANYVMAQFL